MIATSGVKSIMPVLGIMRRKGARSGSVIRNRITAATFVVRGENQDRIALAKMATVSTSHKILTKSIKYAIPLLAQSFGFVIGSTHRLLNQFREPPLLQLE